MNNQTIIYSDINLTKNSKRQQMKSKDAKRSISISEQEIIYADLTLHNASQNLQKNDKNGHCKGSPSPPGKLTAGILGVTCLVLMASIAIVKVINPVIQNHSSVHHCDHCPEDWFYYFNNCYFISSNKKTWTESKTACALNKSNLISMENDEET
ncbi:PREDICTED: NKG2-A/NKG2-B type II integral membrane protein-like, partial [Chrysochloris asiatica]|uniref:NKG2-A/NKG2-B type II integral membrane protein-like n=1 Tax=Chrysochloris asiatica TaxID=185453 RepID=A0A9B0UB49_CHRAS